MKTKSKSMLIGTIFGIVLAGVGTLGAIKVLNLKVEKEKEFTSTIVEKYDYYKIDFNNEFSMNVTDENLSIFLGIDSNEGLAESPLSSIYVDNVNFGLGGIILGDISSMGLLNLKLKNHYDHLVVTAFPYYDVTYSEDESGVKKFERLDCDISALQTTNTLNGVYNIILDKTILSSKNENDKPELTYINLDFTSCIENVIDLSFMSSFMSVDSENSRVYGRIVLNSIEFWNDEASEDIPTSEDSTSTSSVSVVSQ